MKQLTADNSILGTGAFSGISAKRAQTAVQRKRNEALHRASDMLKKDARCHGKSVTIEWQIENSKDRHVQADGIPIFLQTLTDLSGKFLKPFEDLKI